MSLFSHSVTGVYVFKDCFNCKHTIQKSLIPADIDSSRSTSLLHSVQKRGGRSSESGHVPAAEILWWVVSTWLWCIVSIRYWQCLAWGCFSAEAAHCIKLCHWVYKRFLSCSRAGCRTLSFLSLFLPFKRAPLKACTVDLDLCFLVNNRSFHSSAAFSPVAETEDRAKRKSVWVD